MLYEVRTEIIKLGRNFAFARNLSLTMLVTTSMFYGLAELQGQNSLLSERNSITKVSDYSSIKVIVDRK